MHSLATIVFTSALRRVTAIVQIGDLDHSVRDVTFKCFILSHYDNFKKLGSYAYLYADGTDRGTINDEWNV